MKKILHKFITILMIILTAALMMPLSLLTSVRADNETVVNVLYYGANGNDTADDTHAFQQAFDEAKKSSTPVRVVIPYGKYYLGGPGYAAWVYSNTTLDFEEGAVLCRNSSTPSVYLLESEGQKNITITGGGILDGNSSDTAIAKGLMRFAATDNLTVTNMTFRNWCGAHGVTIDGAQGLKVMNCVFTGFRPFTGSASSFTNQTGSNSLWSIEALHIDFIAPSGSYAGRNISNVEVSNCTFDGAASGVGTHHVYSSLIANNIRIHDNVFRNCYYDAVHATGFNNFELYNNTVLNTPSLIWSKNIRGKIYNNILDNRNLAFSSESVNKIYNFGTNYLDPDSLSGMRLSNESEVSANKSVLEIYGNEIFTGNYTGSSGSRVCGIDVFNGCEVNIHDNTVAGSPYQGIYVGDGKAAITGNTISSSYQGIYLKRTSNSSVASNIITGLSDKGIISDSASGTTITGNSIGYAKKTNSGYGIYMVNTSGTNNITGNSVLHSGMQGVHAVSSALGRIDNNFLLDCSSYGIALKEGTKVDSISGNRISQLRQDRNELFMNGASKVTTFAGNETDEGREPDTVKSSADSVIEHFEEPVQHTHSFAAQGSQNASCSRSGYTEYKCSSCGFTYREYTAPSGHNWDGGSLSGNFRKYSCRSGCARSFSEYVPTATAEPQVSAGAARPDFYDVRRQDVSSALHTSVTWAVDKGIILGYKDYTFRPKESCTRSQFVTMLWRMAGRPSAGSGTRSFSDVSSGMSSYKAIRWAASSGIIVGYKDGTFRPSAPLTRSQIVTIIWRMQGKPSAGSAPSFGDVSSSMSAYNAIRWAASRSIVKGYGNGYFGPYDNCTRGQIMIILFRCVERQGIRF